MSVTLFVEVLDVPGNRRVRRTLGRVVLDFDGVLPGEDADDRGSAEVVRQLCRVHRRAAYNDPKITTQADEAFEV